MPDGKFEVLEHGARTFVVLDGLTEVQAKKLVAYLVKLIEDQG